jgi:hypothetical protein
LLSHYLLRVWQRAANLIGMAEFDDLLSLRSFKRLRNLRSEFIWSQFIVSWKAWMRGAGMGYEPLNL